MDVEWWAYPNIFIKIFWIYLQLLSHLLLGGRSNCKSIPGGVCIVSVIALATWEILVLVSDIVKKSLLFNYICTELINYIYRTRSLSAVAELILCISKFSQLLDDWSRCSKIVISLKNCGMWKTMWWMAIIALSFSVWPHSRSSNRWWWTRRRLITSRKPLIVAIVAWIIVVKSLISNKI